MHKQTADTKYLCVSQGRSLYDLPTSLARAGGWAREPDRDDGAGHGGVLNGRSFTHVARPLHYRLHEVHRLLLGPKAPRLVALNVTTWLCIHTMTRRTRPYLGV